MDQPSAPDLAIRPGTASGWFATQGRVVLPLLIGLACLAIAFAREIQAAIDVWNASTAYSHCYLVLPMALYLIWERRSVFGQVAAAPEPGWAVVAVPIGLVWLGAERLGIMEGRQLAALAGMELLLLAILGRKLFMRLLGPLLFLFFLVPFGAFLTPALQKFTAAFSITGLDLLGIPNYSDKFTIETPAGVFFVAEACAGLRFLIAAIAFGVFFALLTYTSPLRRIAFIVASIVVPVIANGFRALGIIVLGQILGSAEAAAADHIVYGWVFFSVVMLVLIVVGQVFREEAPAGRDIPVVTMTRSRHAAGWAAAPIVIILCAGPVTALAIDSGSTAPALRSTSLLVTPAGCVSVPAGTAPDGTAGVIDCGGIRFDVAVTAFSPRSTASSMVATRRRVTQEIGAEDVTTLPVSPPDGAGAWTMVQTTDPNRSTAYASWVDGLPVTSGLAGRLAQARDSLLGTDHAPILITITTAEAARSSPNARKSALERLTRLVSEQTDLNRRVAALSRLPDRPAP